MICYGGVADDQTVAVDRIMCAFHHALAAAGRAPVEIGNVDRLAVIRLDILLGCHRHLVGRAIVEIDDRRIVDDGRCALADGPGKIDCRRVLFVPEMATGDRRARAAYLEVRG
jgi:hypothetical protein